MSDEDDAEFASHTARCDTLRAEGKGECWFCSQVLPIHVLRNIGNTRRCKLCLSAERGLQRFYKNQGPAKEEEWKNMSRDRRRELIVDNKEPSGKGTKRDYRISEEARFPALLD